MQERSNTISPRLVAPSQAPLMYLAQTGFSVGYCVPLGTTATKSTPSPPCPVLGLCVHASHHSIEDGEKVEGRAGMEARATWLVRRSWAFRNSDLRLGSRLSASTPPRLPIPVTEV